MNPSACPAARLPEADRYNLAVLALAGTATITDLAAGHDVSRKFVHQQANKTCAGLAEVFSSSAPDDELMFALPVTKTWLRQLSDIGVFSGSFAYCGRIWPSDSHSTPDRPDSTRCSHFSGLASRIGETP